VVYVHFAESAVAVDVRFNGGLGDVVRTDRCIGHCVCVQSGVSHSDESVGSASSEKTKVLLERMKILEAEKTCLVLENERQCEQYEKCLDDITSQVLQALMSQRVM